jgi:hypothetical protein
VILWGVGGDGQQGYAVGQQGTILGVIGNTVKGGATVQMMS